MLQKETVSRETLELLTTLMDDPLLSEFFLVGGTALSLQIGHRKSIDLDFFTRHNFDADDLLSVMEDKYNFYLDFRSGHALKGHIAGVKVDLIAHKYPLVEPLLLIENIRMAGLADIAAMKLNAIAGNGTRVKDFIDIAYLSSYLSPIQMLDAYQQKYSTRNSVMAIKSLVYHNDIDFNEPIEMMDKKYSWKQIEKRLKEMMETPERIFAPISLLNIAEQKKTNPKR